MKQDITDEEHVHVIFCSGYVMQFNKNSELAGHYFTFRGPRPKDANTSMYSSVPCPVCQDIRTRTAEMDKNA